MCKTCGCSDNSLAVLTDLNTGKQTPLGMAQAEQAHEHARGARHPAAQQHATQDALEQAHHRGRIVRLEQEILARNDRLAQQNRHWLSHRGILALNLISSPGAGKTTLLERTIQDVGTELPISVIEGDQATLNDAERLHATGCRVVQINTGAGCHLEADMTARGLDELDPPRNSVVIVENVGNLVCPALFDLGEHAKVVIMSVTDGEDKPIKYPHAFRGSELMILSKMDLLPYVRFDVEKCLKFARQMNPQLKVLQVSATRGDGLDNWYDWLREQWLRRANGQAPNRIHIPS